jgi:hypothetical protein
LLVFQGAVRVGPQRQNSVTLFGQAQIGLAVLGSVFNA